MCGLLATPLALPLLSLRIAAMLRCEYVCNVFFSALFSFLFFSIFFFPPFFFFFFLFFLLFSLFLLFSYSMSGLLFYQSCIFWIYDRKNNTADPLELLHYADAIISSLSLSLLSIAYPCLKMHVGCSPRSGRQGYLRSACSCGALSHAWWSS